MDRWLPVLGERTSKDVSHEPAVPHTVLSSSFSFLSPDEDPLVQYYSSRIPPGSLFVSGIPSHAHTLSPGPMRVSFSLPLRWLQSSSASTHAP